MLVDDKDKKFKKSHMIGRYLQQFALGIAARLSEVITDNLGMRPSVQEQKRCIQAMEEMIRICNSYVSIARPQVCIMYCVLWLPHTAFDQVMNDECMADPGYALDIGSPVLGIGF
jgi:hypothetical protein